MSTLVLNLDPNRDKPKPRSRPPGGGYFPFAPPPFPAPPGTFNLGVNLSGLQDGAAAPTLTEMQYWANKGISHFRIPLLWGSLQSTNFASLNTGYLTQISGVLASANTAGAKCLIDIHNFGSGPDGTHRVGTSNVPVSAFVDLWTKFSTALRADPNFSAVGGYDLMNEWAGMDPNNPNATSTPAGQAIILQATQGVMTALRSAGDNTKLYLEWDHFSGAWDAVANNIASLMDLALSDPIKNSIVSVHTYMDRDSSGGHFVWLTESITEGQAPPGLSTNINIIPQRLAAVTALAASKQCPMHVGEIGFSSDALNLIPPGNDDYISWNQAADTALTYLKENNYEVHFWGLGDFLTTYGYNPEPSSITNPLVKDFTPAGFQSTQTVILEKYSGYSGAQPTNYRLDAPFGVAPYAPAGTAIPNFKIRYNGKISSDQLYTPRATLPDGTNAGGTFTPSQIDLGPGNNGLASFSYTPAGSFPAINISTTNNAGLVNPPAVAASSVPDFFNTVGSVAPNVYATRRLVNTYVGPAFRLQRATDNAQLDFFFNNRGDLPRQAIQDWSNSRSIAIVTWYDQSGNNSHQVYNSSSIELVLVDTDGYPSVHWKTTASAFIPTPSIGKAATSVYSDVNPANTGVIVTQDQFLTNYRLQASQFGVAPNTASFSATVSFGSTLNVWNELCATYSSLYGANNLKGYLNGGLAQQVNCADFVNSSLGNTALVGNFQFGDIHFAGSMRTLIIHYIEYQSTDVTALHSMRTTYFSTALPDSLSSVNPLIAGAGARGNIPTRTSTPFFGVTISDFNVTPTDTVTLTVSGTAGGTLSGTGLSGSNPYTLASDTPANITTKLQALTYLSSGTTGQSDTITILVNSSAGTSATDSSTVVTLTAVAPAETPFAAPGGTFTPINFKGVNISAAEINYPSPNQFNYIYPQNIELDYFSSKGFGLIRLPLHVRRIQPASYGPLDPVAFLRSDNLIGRADEPAEDADKGIGIQTNLAAIKRVLDHALTKNMWVILEMHNGGVFDTFSGNIVRPVGADLEGTAQFVDWWQRMATKFKNYPNVIFGLENEPVGMTAAQWFTGATAAINAIAAITTARTVFIPGGGNFEGAHDWTSSGNAAAWAGYVPPSGLNIVFEAHQYLDQFDSGTQTTVVAGKGAVVLDNPTFGLATTWARANGFKMFLGETGWSPNDSQPSGGVPSTEGGALMHYMTTNSDVWLGWSYWVGGSNAFYPTYMYSVVPTGYPTGPFTDTHQMSILTANI